MHLYNPRDNPQLWKSTCPPHPFMFAKHDIMGARSDEALPVDVGADKELLPKSDARALVSYLLSMKKDQPVPAALDFAPKSDDGDL